MSPPRRERPDSISNGCCWTLTSLSRSTRNISTKCSKVASVCRAVAVGPRRIDPRKVIASAWPSGSSQPGSSSVNFAAGQFTRETVGAWLAFYLEAQNSAALRRILRVYVWRLRSNLVAPLSELLPKQEADRVAEAVAALIDGFYIRRALRDGLPNPFSAVAIIEDYIDSKVKMDRPA